MQEKSQAVTGKNRSPSGVMEYKTMGHGEPDDVPKDTDVIACLRITPQGARCLPQETPA